MKTEKVLKDLPYTVIGGTSLSYPKQRIIFTGKGIKELAKRIAKDEDSVVYESWADCTNECTELKHFSRWKIITDTNKKGDNDEQE